MERLSLSLLEKLRYPQLRTAKDNLELCVDRDLSGMDLSLGDWSRLRFVRCYLTESRFPATLTETVFEDCIMNGSDLCGCKLYATEFFQCTMNGLKAVRSRWYGRPSMSHCQATSMDWSESLINGLELYNTNITNLYAKHSFFYRFDTWSNAENTVTGMQLPSSFACESGRLDIFSSSKDHDEQGECILLDAWRYNGMTRMPIGKIKDYQKHLRSSETMKDWVLDFISQHEEIPSREQILLFKQF